MQSILEQTNPAKMTIIVRRMQGTGFGHPSLTSKFAGISFPLYQSVVHSS
jgi:hypothetical protein